MALIRFFLREIIGEETATMAPFGSVLMTVALAFTIYFAVAAWHATEEDRPAARVPFILLEPSDAPH
jgi:hypothetical protein